MNIIIKYFHKNTKVFLLLVFFLGLFLRFWRFEHAMPYFYHIDEYFVGSTVLNIIQTGDLNPIYPVYGSFFYYLVAGVVYLISFLFPQIVSIVPIIYTGKIVTILIGSANILIIFFVSKYIFNKNTAILTSFFLAIFPIDIYICQVFKGDSLIVMMILLSLYFSFRIKDNGNTKWYIFGGISSGIALATKYFFPVLIPLFISHIAYNRNNNGVYKNIIINNYKLFILIYTSLFVFVLSNPFYFIYYKEVIFKIQELRKYSNSYSMFYPWYYFKFFREIVFVFPVVFGPFYFSILIQLKNISKLNINRIIFISFPLFYFFFAILFFPGIFHIHWNPVLSFVIMASCYYISINYDNILIFKKYIYRILFYVSLIFCISNIIYPHYSTILIVGKYLGKWIVENGKYSDIMFIGKIEHPTDIIKSSIKYNVEAKIADENLIFSLKPDYIIIDEGRKYLEDKMNYPKIYDKLENGYYDYIKEDIFSGAKIYKYLAKISFPTMMAAVNKYIIYKNIDKLE